MIVLRATFVGTNGSRGYRTGQRYTFRVRGNRISPLVAGRGPQPCPYLLEGFFENWREIEVINGPTYMD